MKRFLITLTGLTLTLLLCCCHKSIEEGKGEDPNVNPPEEQSGLFSGGEGSLESPYKIASEKDLRSLASLSAKGDSLGTALLSGHFVQTAPIAMSARGIYPIAHGKAFSGFYDGAGLPISGLVVKSSSNNVGLFACLDGATVSGVVLEDLKLETEYLVVGGIAGLVKGESNVLNCSVSGLVKGTKDGSYKSYSGASFLGGVVGVVEQGSKVEGCRFDGNTDAAGQISGGIVGYLHESTIENCTVASSARIINYATANAARIGGIVGQVETTDENWESALVSGCRMEGLVNSSRDRVGGIVGHLQGGRLVDCAVVEGAEVVSRNSNIGGLVGFVYAGGKNHHVVIDGCSVACNVIGTIVVGGLVGKIECSGGGLSKVVIANSGYALGGITCTTSGNLSMGGTTAASVVAGGIVAYATSSASTTSENTGTFFIANCYSYPSAIQYISASRNVIRGALGGIIGWQEKGKYHLVNCVSGLNARDLNVATGPAVESATNYWGAVYGLTLISGCSWDNVCWVEGSDPWRPGPGYASLSKNVKDGQALSSDALADGATVLAKMNGGSIKECEGVQLRSWAKGYGPYPVIAGHSIVAPSTEGKKRVSLIGDSISTFAGYIPAGYSYHYPATTATGCKSWTDTYWWKLIYGKMTNACFDTNIAYSGSAVAKTDRARHDAHYSSAQHWLDYCFTDRFIAKDGMGNPDVILIHGGTNDYYHNCDSLYDCAYGRRHIRTSTYDASVVDKIIADAQKATSYEAAKSLPDGDFVCAYTKLLQLIRTRHPKAKVVCIIGDCLSPSIEKSIIQMAEAYDFRWVDLFAINGWGDERSSLENEAKNPFPACTKDKNMRPMPKHDDACHPSCDAMTYIADYIYEKVGDYIDK